MKIHPSVVTPANGTRARLRVNPWRQGVLTWRAPATGIHDETTVARPYLWR